MILQISAGQGPEECQRAVGGVYEALKAEEADITLISARKGQTDGCYHSILFETSKDLSELEGTILWVCKSPFRPGHKRKNWYVDVSVIPEAEEVDEIVCRAALVSFGNVVRDGERGAPNLVDEVATVFEGRPRGEVEDVRGEFDGRLPDGDFFELPVCRHGSSLVLLDG